ncbi:MAG: hypothetical protein ACTSRG_22875 [Candidatus Helarchaeota archaeon]
MIGVISEKSENKIVEEFFHLFKTPWEFYDKNRTYDVVINSSNKFLDNIKTKILFIFGFNPTEFDIDKDLILEKIHTISCLKGNHVELPIYKGLSIFKNVSNDKAILNLKSEIVGFKCKSNSKTFIRIGYNIFKEIEFLLLEGQPIENATIPTLENHIALLRKWIVNSGVTLVEIPPVPAGYNFITCLTHDVDFIKISNHTFDHSYWGFVYRALFMSFKELIKGNRPFIYVLKNWIALFSLPIVHLGFLKDFWFQFDRYLEIEKGLKSTFFFIPFKNKAGDKISSKNASFRAAKYDINDLKGLLNYLINEGNEAGIHGINAWHDFKSGYQERNRISEIIGESNLGIRMHWLLYDNQTFQSLEKACYYYDSTFGYNETVGYRGGTTQVFKPNGVKNLLELPMHIQDTALFFPRRMDLSEKQALNLCKKLINNASIYGGVLTLNWHQRSLGPERLWGDLYLKLLKELKLRNTWFASAGQAVEWFKKRRAILFKDVKFSRNKLLLSLRSDEINIKPPLTIRIYRPISNELENNDFSIRIGSYIDIPWNGKREIEVLI